MKKIAISAILALSMILPTSVFAESQSITVLYDGTQIEFAEQPVIEDGTTLVQFRPLFEKLGLTIQWDEQTKKITGKKEGLDLTIQIDNKIAIVNGNQITLDLAPKIVNGNTVVPLRFVGESTGKEVSWDQASYQVSIKSKTQNDEIHNFRKVDWGMTREQIKKSEASTFLKEDSDIIGYSAEKGLLDYDVKIIYEFANNKLIRGAYSIDSPSLIRFYDIKEQLTKKYGKPSTDQEELNKKLNGDSYKVTFDTTGRLSTFVTWKVDNTEILLTIEGKNYSVTSLILSYKDTTYIKPKPSTDGL